MRIAALPAPSSDAAIAWQGFARDRRNSGNLASGVSPTATSGDPKQGLIWALGALKLTLGDRVASGPSSLRRSSAPAAIDWTIFALDKMNVPIGAAILPYIDRGLTYPAENAPLLQDLRADLGSAVSRAGRQALSRKVCALGDNPCLTAASKAKAWLELGDQLALKGRASQALTAWAAALRYVL